MRLPTDEQRISIIGKTGSGKTYAAVWHLSMRSFDVRPWVIYDFKMDTTINEIPLIRHIDTSEVPKKPGVYVVHPLPSESVAVQEQLWKIWSQENVGVFIDEGYMLNPSGVVNPAFRALLTQGRSKNIPVICLSQRPAWLDRFVFSESDFYQVFYLNDARDRKTVQAFVPADMNERLPEYHSWYYDVGDNNDSTNLIVLKPVPKKQTLLDTFDRRLRDTRTTIFI